MFRQAIASRWGALQGSSLDACAATAEPLRTHRHLTRLLALGSGTGATGTCRPTSVFMAGNRSHSMAFGGLQRVHGAAQLS